MIFKRKKPPESVVDSAQLDAVEDKAQAALRALLMQRERVDAVALAAAREVRINGFTRRFEHALGYPGGATTTGTD